MQGLWLRVDGRDFTLPLRVAGSEAGCMPTLPARKTRWWWKRLSVRFLARLFGSRWRAELKIVGACQICRIFSANAILRAGWCRSAEGVQALRRRWCEKLIQSDPCNETCGAAKGDEGLERGLLLIGGSSTLIPQLGCRYPAKFRVPLPADISCTYSRIMRFRCVWRLA